MHCHLMRGRRMRHPRAAATIALAAHLLAAACLPGQRARPTAAPERARLIVLSDIGNEPDDTQSFVRLLLYSNVIDLEGLVATTSIHMRDHVEEYSIRALIAAYGQVRQNLLRHEPGFPTTAQLASITSHGLATYGMGGVGDGKDSPGSALIIRALQRPDPRPLWVSVWGGPNTLAQALYRMRKDFSPDEVARLVAKLRVYTISDQDDSGPWIRAQFPTLSYIVSPGGYGAATWTGMNMVEEGADNSEISTAWITEHIQQGHGPLGAKYPDVSYGMEGDTPSFLGLIPNGLNVPEHPEYGGWGGRYRLAIPALADMDPQGFNGGVPILPEVRPIWTNTVDSLRPFVPSAYGRAYAHASRVVGGFRTTIWRWRKDVQADFAARMLWATRDVAHANHPPVAMLGMPDHLRARSGAWLALSARGSHDPDGDAISTLWFNYAEAGDLPREIAIDNADNGETVHVRLPVVTSAVQVQFILQVRDHGTPALSRYRRVYVTIEP